MGITAKCVHSITQDPTDTELPSRFPRPCYNWPLLSAEGEGAVCNEVSWTRSPRSFYNHREDPNWSLAIVGAFNKEKALVGTFCRHSESPRRFIDSSIYNERDRIHYANSCNCAAVTLN